MGTAQSWERVKLYTHPGQRHNGFKERAGVWRVLDVEVFHMAVPLGLCFNDTNRRREANETHFSLMVFWVLLIKNKCDVINTATGNLYW